MKLSVALAGMIGVFMLGVILMSEGITGMASSEEAMLAGSGIAVPAMDLVRFYAGTILLCSIVALLGLSSLKIIKIDM